MTITQKCLVEAQYAPITETPIYTANGVRASIDSFTVTNVTATAATLVVKIVPSGGTAGTSNAITPVATPMSIAANSVFTGLGVVGQVLNTGDVLSLIAGTASALVIRVSGRELT